MKIGKISKKNSKLLNTFINKIYTDYITKYDEYLKNIIKIDKDDRLEHVLHFINTWTRSVMDIANDYDIIKNIINLSNDISVHKNGTYTIAIEVFDDIQSVLNCKEFGSIIAIFKEDAIIASGLLRYSYIQQLIFSINNTTTLYNYSDKLYNISVLKSPTNGNTYFMTDGKNIAYSKYGVYQFVDKLKSTHNLEYSNSIVQNIFHIIINGGVYISAIEESGNTDIKLLLHAFPIAFIAQNCGLVCYSGNETTMSLEYPVGKRGLKTTTQLVIGSDSEMKQYCDIINPSLVFFD